MASNSDQQQLVTSDEFDVFFGSSNTGSIATKDVAYAPVNTVATDIGVIFSSAANTVVINKEDMKIYEKKNLLNNYTDSFFGFNRIDNESVLKNWFTIFNAERVTGHNMTIIDFTYYLEKYQNRRVNDILDADYSWDFHTAIRNDSLHSTLPSFKESNFIKVLENLGNRFEFKNKSKLFEFLFEKARFYSSDLDLDFQMIFDTIEKFLLEKNLQSNNEIELYIDHEIDDLRTVSVLLNIKGINVDQSLSYTDELIQRIASYNKNILEFIQIEISPL